jgi:translation initiation factor IF-2
MGHVDHGKTSLLDYIRKANVANKEAGGITQHIGAYDVKVPKHDRKITFIDTPGHEAFTAMRARGAKLTDIAIIVIAADDKVMPQTREAISHAQSANVPMIFAINKIDKPGANPEGVRTQLSEMNVLVESWGGKFQDQEISAKSGLGIEDLLEKILLEADLLELKANAKKLSTGTVIEASLDKGRGYVATVLVLSGTLEVGDFLVVGSNFGKIKAMFDHTGTKVTKVYPGEPVQILGLNGAPTAGETFREFSDEQEAKNIAYKRSQLEREQGIRTKKHITLDEIGRRLALGTFKELNIIIKGDVDGSVQALSDSLTKLSTPEVQVNILHKAVGAITESDVLLASASDAIIIGFQVRPSAQAKAIAERESIDIRHYSVIYQAIDEIKAAMEGMLEPTVEEKVTGNIEIKEVFKISKVGTIAGCYVTDGKVTRTSKVRIIRDGIVVHSGKLASLKRFKDDVKEVIHGQDCGLNIDNFNDIQIGDIIEAYEEIEIKRKLS